MEVKKTGCENPRASPGQTAHRSCDRGGRTPNQTARTAAAAPSRTTPVQRRQKENWTPARSEAWTEISPVLMSSTLKQIATSGRFDRAAPRRVLPAARSGNRRSSLG